MRVLVLHNRYRRPGGEDAVVRRETAMLRAHGVDVVEHAVDNEVEHGVIGNVALLAGSAWSRASYDSIARLGRELRPDLVHVHNSWMRLTPSVLAAAREGGAATVQTLHNYRLICVNGLLLRNGRVCEDCAGRTPWRGVARRCYHGSAVASAAVARWILENRRRETWTRFVDAFILPSESARASLRPAALPEERVFVKPHFTEDPGSASGPASCSRAVLFAGRLSPEKGVRVLLSAWSALAGSLPSDARLVIVGDGPERAALEAMARRSGAPVAFTGQAPAAEMALRIAGARALVLPSLSLETFGTTVIEAFACGRAAIVSDLGGPAELVRDAWSGWKVAPGDHGALARALEKLFADDALADWMGRNARATYLERYTEAANFRMLSRIYAAALRRRHAAPVEPVQEAACLA